MHYHLTTMGMRMHPGLQKGPRLPDNHGMPAHIAPGCAATVICRSDKPGHWNGSIVAVKESGIALRLAAPPPSWDAAAAYMVVCGEPGHRMVVPARFVASSAAAVAFRPNGDWEPLDFRRDPRFRTDMRAEVRSVLGSSRQTGRVIDVSMGGMAVLVEARPGGRQVSVGVVNGGFGAHLLCDVVAADDVEDGVLLRLKFTGLNPPQQAFVRQLVGGLMDSAAE